jgi:hypothetical protein
MSTIASTELGRKVGESRCGTIWAPIDKWCEISGFGRTTTYQHLALGNLRAKKAGKRTLVHIPSGLAFIESLPDAEVKTGLSQRTVAANSLTS